MNTDKVYDVAVVGAGVVGSAIARDLARFDISCCLLEAAADVGSGTSKANTAIWHTGFDAKPGTLECRLLRRSYDLLGTYMPAAGVPAQRLGAVLIAWNDDQLKELPKIVERAHQNGVTDVRLLTVEEVYDLEPHVSANALGGLIVPGEGILCTYTLPLALASEAVANGVSLKLSSRVTAVRQEGGVHVLQTTAGEVACRYLVNAAGLYSDEVDHLLGHNDFDVTPRRGELIVFDKFARPLVNHVLLPVPTAITKGVLISPTVYGNVMLGPTAEDLQDKTDKSTSAKGLEFLWQKGQAILPTLLDEEVTATYAGLRAATQHSDYQIRLHAEQRYVCVGGIRSTGVSASLGIAEYVVGLLDEAGLALSAKTTYKPVRMPNISELGERPYQSEAKIAGNPDNGRIVCHCEQVTKGELVDAVHSTIPAGDLEGMKRRTRAMQGRCQGFNCQAHVAALLAHETGRTIDQVLSLDHDQEQHHAA
jgi:glycerol-3-phosphate dehydrogenase